MTTLQLKARLFRLACQGLAEANRKNPFITKAEAMRDLNKARTL